MVTPIGAQGVHVQPHTAECRSRMETTLSSDIRVKNAKAWMERSARRKNSPNEVPDTAKRRKLEDIEDQVMKEENPTKIAELFDRYRAEYLNDRVDIGGNAKRQKSEESVLLREQASGSHQSATYAEVGVEKITEGNVDPWEFLEAVGSDNNNPTQCLKPLESRGENGLAWDDVNSIALPLELVKKARQEEMSYMKGDFFQVVKVRSLADFRRSSNQHQMGGHECLWFSPDGWPGTSRTPRRRTEKICSVLRRHSR